MHTRGLALLLESLLCLCFSSHLRPTPLKPHPIRACKYSCLFPSFVSSTTSLSLSRLVSASYSSMCSTLLVCLACAQVPRHALSGSISDWIFLTSSSEGFWPRARSTVPRSPTRMLLSPFLSKSEKASRNSCVCSALNPWCTRQRRKGER